jgi:Cu-Zn family superoxide dismutase
MMGKVLTALALAGMVVLPGVATAKVAPKDKVLASAALMKGDAMPAGLASIVESKGKLGLKLSLSGLPAGVHAVHLHMRGVCEVPGFTSAGGHLNPAGHQHGRDNPMGAYGRHAQCHGWRRWYGRRDLAAGI